MTMLAIVEYTLMHIYIPTSPRSLSGREDFS